MSSKYPIVETFCMQVSGIAFQTDSILIPNGGVIVGITMAAGFASVTNAAEYLAVVSPTQYAASGDIDAGFSGKRNIYAVIRMRVGFVTSGLAAEAVNQFFPVRIPISPNQFLYLQSSSQTNAIVCSAIIHVAR